jgi:NADPH2:quinone reductase
VQRVQRELFDWYAQGKIKPHVMGAWPFEKYREALATVRDRKVVGKVVIMTR